MGAKETIEATSRLIVLRETARRGVTDIDAGRMRIVQSQPSSAPEAWIVIITAVAETDLQEILRWGGASFGAARAQTDSQLLSQAVESLSAGSDIAGSTSREDIGADIFTLNVAGTHDLPPYLVLFRLNQTGAQRKVEVLRVLHGALDEASADST